MPRVKKNSSTPTWTGMPQNHSELLKIKASIDATHESIVAIENEKAQLTDIFEEIHQETGMPRRVFNFLVKSNFYGNQEQTFSKNAELEEAWYALEKV